MLKGLKKSPGMLQEVWRDPKGMLPHLAGLLVLDFRYALRGRMPYQIGTERVAKAHENCDLVSEPFTVYGLSIIDALQIIAEGKPQNEVFGLWPLHRFICVQLLVAYPCRAARWIFGYRQMSRIEREAVIAILNIKSRQDMLRKVDGGNASSRVLIPADAPETPTLPENEAQATVGREKSIAMNDHGAGLAGSPAAGNEKAVSTPTQALKTYGATPEFLAWIESLDRVSNMTPEMLSEVVKLIKGKAARWGRDPGDCAEDMIRTSVGKIYAVTAAKKSGFLSTPKPS